MISVITITKNNPEGFARTKASVEGQSYPAFEWIVIDGAHEPDAGIYDAMNKGLDRACHHHVMFMNAGDIFAGPEVLKSVAQHLDFDFIYGDAIEDGKLKRARHTITRGMPTHHQAMIYKKSHVRFDTAYQIAADYKFTAYYMQRGSQKYLPLPICVFEQGGISQQKTALGRHEQTQIRRELNIHAPLAMPMQVAAQTIKTHAPALYWFLRGG